MKAFQIETQFYWAIIEVSYIENPEYTLEKPNWAERVVVLTKQDE